MKNLIVFLVAVVLILASATAASARWVPGLVHIHQDSKTFEDDGFRTQDEIIDKAIKQHLQFVITTPHYHPGANRTIPSQSDKIILIDGAEIETIWGGDMRSHTLVLGDFYGDPIIDQLEGKNNTQQALLNRLNELGFLSIAAHPTLVEIVTLELWKGQSGNFCFDLGNVKNLRGVEWFNSGKDGYEGTRRISLLLSQLQDIFFTAGCDSHTAADPHDPYRWTRMTVVWVEGDVTKGKILDAFRQGRTYASQYGAYIKEINFRPGFNVNQVDEDRTTKLKVTLAFPKPISEAKKVRLYLNGQAFGRVLEWDFEKGQQELTLETAGVISHGDFNYIIEIENCLITSPVKFHALKVANPETAQAPRPVEVQANVVPMQFTGYRLPNLLGKTKQEIYQSLGQPSGYLGIIPLKKLDVDQWQYSFFDPHENRPGTLMPMYGYYLNINFKKSLKARAYGECDPLSPVISVRLEDQDALVSDDPRHKIFLSPRQVIPSEILNAKPIQIARASGRADVKSRIVVLWHIQGRTFCAEIGDAQPICRQVGKKYYLNENGRNFRNADHLIMYSYINKITVPKLQKDMLTRDLFYGIELGANFSPFD